MRLQYPLTLRFAARRFCAPASPLRVGRPLLQPPVSGKGPVELVTASGLDLDLAGVPTLSVIGPSRRGKSVLASILAGGDPATFKQSHSSFQAMTSGTHVVEVEPSPGMPVRLIDTEGLSHVGRSRSSEALVRQFLISTYLTSSHIIWLDNDVLSSSFFTMMWLVYDYVVDVLRVKHAAGGKLPRLMYVRTQETDVQRREYSKEFKDFGAFFTKVLETHEDGAILEQMFAPGGIAAHSLPVWTVEDLDSYESGRFWLDDRESPFKTAVSRLRGDLLPSRVQGQASKPAEEGPPLLTLSSLDSLLPKIAKLEAFDPRDHETTKIQRLRNQLRSAFGRLGDKPADVLRLVNLFEAEDKDVRRNNGCLRSAVRARLEAICEKLRLEPELAEAEPEVARLLALSARTADVFTAGLDLFATEGFSERGILDAAIERWGLDADEAERVLKADLASAQARFLEKFGAVAGLEPSSMKRFRLYERALWRVDDSVMRLRARTAVKLPLRKVGGDESEASAVWRLGEWQGSVPTDGKTVRRKAKEFALWTDGSAWELYVETKDAEHAGGKWVGVLQKSGELGQGASPLPTPSPPLGGEQSSLDAINHQQGSGPLMGGAL